MEKQDHLSSVITIYRLRPIITWHPKTSLGRILGVFRACLDNVLGPSWKRLGDENNRTNYVRVVDRSLTPSWKHSVAKHLSGTQRNRQDPYSHQVLWGLQVNTNQKYLNQEVGNPI